MVFGDKYGYLTKQVNIYYKKGEWFVPNRTGSLVDCSNIELVINKINSVTATIQNTA